MEIEPIRPEDRKELRELELSLYREYLDRSNAFKWEELSPELIEHLGATTEEAFKFYLDTGMSFVAREGGNIVGFIFARMIDFIYGIDRIAWIENLGVHPEYRRLGIGYRLIKKVAEAAKEKGAEILVSSIMSDNIESLMLHKKLGFLLEGRHIALLDLESSDL